MIKSSPPPVVSIFVSSPNDLVEERRGVKAVIERLSGDDFGGTRLRLKALLWEDHVPAVVGGPAQIAVDYYLGTAAQAEIYIGLFWTRLGSPVVIDHRRVDSGTMYEFTNAYSSHKATGRPKMLLYRCVRPPDPSIADASSEKVDAFFRGFHGEFPRFEGLPKAFSTLVDLDRYLENDLRVVLEDLVANGPLLGPVRSRDGLASKATARQVSWHPLLLEGVQEFLRNFDDIYGDGREKDHSFTVPFLSPGLASPRPDGPDNEPLETGNSLLDLYERLGRRLLLMGPTGSGKTFAMLKLMQDLIDKARRAGSGPIPVYFNLSSWVLTRSRAGVRTGRAGLLGGLMGREKLETNPTMDDWFVDELVRRYAMPRKVARQLVNNRQLIFCLDGLDELSHVDDLVVPDSPEAGAKLRGECVMAINRTLRDQSMQMVLCCRDDTFEQLPEKPRLGEPLLSQPISVDDGVRYLKEWVNLDGLREAMAESLILKERSRIPLFLQIMAVAYRGMSKQPILEATRKPEGEWETHLIDNYVQQCLSFAPVSDDSLSKSDISKYLSWLARGPDSDFLVEDLQPSSLSSAEGGPGEAWYRTYRRLSVGSLSLFLSLTCLVPSGVAIGLEWTASATPIRAALHGLVIATLTGTVIFPMAIPAFATRRWWVFGVMLGGAMALVRGITIALSPREGLGGTLQEGVQAGVATMPCATAVFLLLGYQLLGRIEQHRRRYRDRPGIERFEIQPLESFDWRWFDRSTWWRGGWLGLVVGPTIGAIFWARLRAIQGPKLSGSWRRLFVTVFSGLSGTVARVSFEPNQGIIRSFKHAILMMSLFTCTSVLAFALCYGTVHGPFEGLINGILGLGLTFTFLVFVGIPVVKHVCLGHVLHLQGALPGWLTLPPWRGTLAFLDSMVRYKLLRRSAGGYAFRHDRLRQYYRRIID